MKPSEIQVGKTYGNGRTFISFHGKLRKTTRKVFRKTGDTPRSDSVNYEEFCNGEFKHISKMMVNNFAKWAKEEVK